MKKLTTEQIDDQIIVTGFNLATSDPVATQRSARVIIVGTDIEGDGHDGIAELVPLAAKRAKSSQYMREMVQAKTAAGKALTEADAAEIAIKLTTEPAEIANLNDVHKVDMQAFANQDKIYRARKASLEVINEELKPLVANFNKRAKEIIGANPVYFEPNAGEYVDRDFKVDGKDETHLEATGVFLPNGQTVDGLIGLWMAKAERTQIEIDGSNIEDWRGVKFWFQTDGKWGKRTIVALGDFPGDTEREDELLTIAEREEIGTQLEGERIEALSAEDKQAEFTAADDSLVTQAAVMKTKLEIQGSTAAKALTDSKAWYVGELDILKTKYGVE